MKTSTKFLGIALLSLMGLGKSFAQVASFTWSPNSPCVSQTVQITNTSTGGTITGYGYSLTGATSSTYAVANPIVTFTASGSQTVVLVIFNGVTPIGSATNIIVVKAAPTITVSSSQPTAACPGTSATLTAVGGTAYVWNAPVSSSLAIATITVPSVTTTYSVVGTGTNGCTSTGTVSQMVTANPVVIVTSKTLMCTGETQTLTASGGTSYAWVAPLTSTVATAAISPTVVGTTNYYVMSTSTTCPGYTWTTAFTQSVSACTALQQLVSQNVSFGVYPNPTSGDFTIELNNGSAKTIEVIDFTGRIVVTNTTSNDKINVNISALAKGIYYVRVQSNNTFETAKIIKQ